MERLILNNESVFPTKNLRRLDRIAKEKLVKDIGGELVINIDTDYWHEKTSRELIIHIRGDVVIYKSSGNWDTLDLGYSRVTDGALFMHEKMKYGSNDNYWDVVARDVKDKNINRLNAVYSEIIKKLQDRAILPKD